METISLNQLLAATGGKAIGFESEDVVFPAVGIDSRTINPGELFWAVEGEQHDGHTFVGEAFNRGAASCVVESDKISVTAGPVIVVENTLSALGDFSRWYRTNQEALVVGVTGSVGKTTTREMIHAALQTSYAGTRSPNNYNNHFGLPLSILEIEKHHEFAVLELGASAIGEIRDLSEIALPEIGVVTGIGSAHLKGFGSAEGIIQAKGELIESLPRSGFAILAGDDPSTRQLAERATCRVICVGEKSNNDLCATNVEIQANRIQFQVDGDPYEFAAVGRHHLTPALIAIAIGREIGMPSRDIAAGLKKFEAVPGRCRLEQIGPWTVIDDTYNASPTSMKAACDILSEWQDVSGKILVTGDMLELGSRSESFHHELGQMASGAGIDMLAAHGGYAAEVVQGAADAGMDIFRLAECEYFESMLAVLDCWLEPGSMILVKGSRGMEMERVVAWLRQRAEHEYLMENNTPAPAMRACA